MINIQTGLGWWQSRSARERFAVTLGIAAIFCTLVFLLINPVIKEKSRLNAEIPKLREDLTWMQAHMDEVKLLQRQDSPGSRSQSQHLTPAAVENVLRREGLLQQVTDLRPNEQRGVSISFGGVPYADLMDFLYELNVHHTVEVDYARVQKLSAIPGLVNANLSLSIGRG